MSLKYRAIGKGLPFAGNYQIAAVTALILLVPAIAFMLLIERLLNPEMLARVG